MTITRGVEDDVLMTLPAFVYSDNMMSKSGNDTDGSGCSIFLADYKETDVIRLLPECGHLFHIKCVDTWLKVHPNCPVCRKLVTSGSGHTLLNGDRINLVQSL
ncbi:putative RING-H2 finger protein ATL71 [Rutidosis leptorrhynchoides]|uniref:putative RING-H2 finger protein ATL71 n=1 Tax=Rutidosis leptorrhynchoides TaxID=125765 RepID=UPI003A9954AD